MKPSHRLVLYSVAAFALALVLAATVAACGSRNRSTAPPPGGGNPCGANPCASNPCGANPCGANPCGANPCGANPCGANPCGANPCGANPCGGNPCGGGGASVDPARVKAPAGFVPNGGGLSDAQLLAKGEALWNDASLSKTKSLSCETCHKANALYKPSFAAPYPHLVAMAKEKSGIASLSAAEMVQFCMLVPMQAETFSWKSVELAALTRVVHQKQAAYAAARK